MKKRIISIILALVMVVGLLPTSVFAASDPNNNRFDISEGTITIVNGTTIGTVKVTYGSAQSKDNINPATMLTITGKTTSNMVIVNTSNDRTVKITLDSVDIQLPNAGAFDIQGASVVEMTLVGTNILKSGLQYAGLQVENGYLGIAAVTIGGDGSLETTGGEDAAGIGGRAEWYGNNGANAGKITIISGTVKATGTRNGGGIGGGGAYTVGKSGGAGGEVTITGGTVIATGGSWRGAGIGGGGSTVGGAGGTIKITGGNVTAIGGGNAAGIGGGSNGDGGAVGAGAAGNIKISNTAKVIAISWGTKPSIDDNDGNITPDSGTVANVLVANFQSAVSSYITEVKDASGNALSPLVSFAPQGAYKSIAFTVPMASYTLYTGAAKQMGTKSSTTSTTFTVAAGLNVFTDVTASTYSSTVTVNKDGSTWTTDTPTIKMSTSSSSITGAVSGTLLDGVYTFSGLADGKTYYVWEDGTTDSYTGQSVTKASSSATVNYYTVTFKNEDGNTTLNAQTVLSGKTASYGATTPTKTADAEYSYTFSKWVTAVNGTTDATLTNITEAKDVYASFMKTLQSYTITWKQDSSNTIGTTTVAYGEMPNHADATKTGYNFGGWSPSITSVTGNATYTAIWTADSYKITYQLNGGNVSTANPGSYTIESSAITLKNPTRDGYSFVGWSGTDLIGNTNQSVTIASNSIGVKVYTANWKANAPLTLETSVVAAKTSTTLTISTEVGYEYSLDGTSWYSGTNDSYTFTGLNPGQSYNLVCRKASVTTEGSVSAASDSSPAVSVTTKKDAPPAPTLAFAAITENSVTITAVDGAEYSKDDGATWQNENSFTNLESATKYTFAVHIKETADTIGGTKASEEKFTLLPADAAAGASYSNMTQAEATSEDVIKEALKKTATEAVNDDSVTVTIDQVSYTKPLEGTSAKPAGTDGSYKFTVALSKNGQAYNTEEKTIVISATAFLGVSDVAAVAAAKTAIKDGNVTVAFRADQTAKTVAVQSYIDGLLEGVGDAEGVIATVTYNSGTGQYDIKISKGSVEESKTITMTIDEDADPDIATVDTARNGAESAIYLDMTQEVATEKTVIEAALKATAESAVQDATVTVTVEKISYTAPTAGTSGNPGGTNGSYVFKIKVTKGEQTRFTSIKSIVIVATPDVAIPTYKITGTVQDDKNVKISDATVKIMHGQNQVGLAVQTDTSGNFTIENVQNGTYNLVVSKNGITVTTLVVVNNANNTLESTIILPSGKTNSVVEVKPSTPSIVVGGLDTQFKETAIDNNKGVTLDDNAVVTQGGSVEIKLTAEKKDNTATNASDISATATSNGKTVGIFVDLSVLKTVKNSSGDEIPSQSATLTELPSLIDVLIPLDSSLRGRLNYVVYRYHGADVDTITTEANPEGEKIELVDKGATIKLTVKKFSTYAIAYKTPKHHTGGGTDSSAASSTITTEQSEGGKITISNDKKIATIIPNDGYVIADVMVDGKSVGTTEKYAFTDSNTHKINAVFVKKTELPYYIQNDAKIYIGFSAITENLYKYIAPNGVTVKFKENAKNFKDNTIAWAKPSIDYVTEREIFLGTTLDKFGPNDYMTRAMFVTAIGRLYERSYGSVLGTSTFSDVDANAYYEKYVAWANEKGIIKGIGENKFAPNDKVTREQMAVIMQNFANLLKKADVECSSLAYVDSTKISTWAIDGAKYCQQTKVITGRNGGSFAPQESATRDEVAAVIERFIKTIVK